MAKKNFGGFNKFLTNNYALYLFAFLSFIDIWNHLRKNDTQSLFLFIIAAYVTSMYTDNVTIMLIIGLVASNIYKVTTEGFYDESDLTEDGTDEQENEEEAFKNKGDDSDSDDDSDDETEAKIEKLSNKSPKDVSKDQVKDAKELADVQSKLLSNLKEMTPLIQKVEGFADKYKNNVSDENVEKLIETLSSKK